MIHISRNNCTKKVRDTSLKLIYNQVKSNKRKGFKNETVKQQT